MGKYFVVLGIYVIAGIIQVNKFIKEDRKKDCIVFVSILLVLGIINTMILYGIKFPNLSDGISKIEELIIK